MQSFSMFRNYEDRNMELNMDVAQLIEQCKQGDEQALGKLYAAYAQQMRGVCRRYINDRQTVDDVLHDAFVIIFTSFDRLRDKQRADAWMRAIVRNVALKYKEHRSTFPMISLEETNEAEFISTEEEDLDVRGVPLDEVLRMVDRLPDGYGKVFRLSVFEGMTHKEIAEELGIASHSSSSQLARAKKMLRKMMTHYWGWLLLPILLPVALLLFRLFPSDSEEEKANERKTITKNEQQPMNETADAGAPLLPNTPTPIYTSSHKSRSGSTGGIQTTVIYQVDSLPSADTLYNINKESMAEHQQEEKTDSIPMEQKDVMPHIDIADLLNDKPLRKIQEQRWSFQLAYARGYDEQNQYNQACSFSIPRSTASELPVPSDPTHPAPVIPSSIDNWTDYAIYLSNHPEVGSAKLRGIMMRIALNNSDKMGGEDKIQRSSHHFMPISWSLSLNYQVHHRWAVETGVQYNRLTSECEIGTDENAIHERQTVHYLGIPAKAIYQFHNSKRWNIYSSAGMMLEMPVHATLHSDYFIDGEHEADEKTTFKYPWQFSTHLGIGLQFNITPSIGIFAEPSLQYFIPTGSSIETYRSEHPFGFNLPLGIRFTWK